MDIFDNVASYPLPLIPVNKRCIAPPIDSGPVCPSMTRTCKWVSNWRQAQQPRLHYTKKLRVAAHSDKQAMQRHSDSLWLSVPQSDSSAVKTDALKLLCGLQIH